MKKIYLLLCFSIASAFAQDGTMDNTFNFNGANGVSIGPFTDEAMICHLQSDNKLVAGGVVSDSFSFGYKKMGLARFDNGGNLDLTFGTNGITLLYPNNQDHFIKQIESDSAGNMFVLGTYGSRTCVVKLSVNGIIDLNFGNAGFIMNESLEVTKMALLNDGKFLIYGTGWIGAKRVSIIKRFTTNGLLDNSFGVNGVATINIGTSNNFSGWIFVQPDGKIVATGYYDYVENELSLEKMFLSRMLENGEIDNSYGIDGFNTSTEMKRFRYAKMNADATITVMAIRSSPTVQSNYIRTKFDSNGNTIADQSIYFYASGTAVTMQPDGKMLFAGSYIIATEANGANCFFSRQNIDGSYDPTFGNQGMLRKSFSPGNEGVTDMKVGAEGKIYFVGNKMAANFEFLVGRINSGLVLETATFANETIAVSPNPVANILHINSKYLLRECKIFDLQGRIVKNTDKLESIDVSELPSGMYILSAVSTDNRVLNAKFVKQ